VLAMTKSDAKRTVATMTIEELRNFVKQIIEAERRKDCYVDDDGTLVFYSEEGYANYLKKVGKPPSKVKAVFLNEDGLKCRYSDYKLTPQEKRRLARIRKQIAEERVVPGEVVFEKLRKRGIEV
jgi:NifU-like protein involved in Fe-S cluster formation